MSRQQIIALIRKDELQRFREYVDDRPQIYVRYVLPAGTPRANDGK